MYMLGMPFAGDTMGFPPWKKNVSDPLSIKV
jgi:hypothetical protein